MLDGSGEYRGIRDPVVTPLGSLSTGDLPLGPSGLGQILERSAVLVAHLLRVRVHRGGPWFP